MPPPGVGGAAARSQCWLYQQPQPEYRLGQGCCCLHIYGYLGFLFPLIYIYIYGHTPASNPRVGGSCSRELNH
ncbi:hypothetical protein IMY05_008G0065100 [Salix suchowensis]|nr:hypothetical protein IMY05_008G0065100 [Salix suchowensis]